MRDNTTKTPVQEIADNFWEEVALRIEKEFNLGHPSDWEQAQMAKFSELFEERIPSLIPADYDKLSNPDVSVSTIRRIFVTKNSKGNASNRDLFSWLLGYDSFQDYIIKKNKTIQQPIKKRIIKKTYLGLFLFTLVFISLITWSYSSALPPKNEDNIAIIQVIKNAMQVELEARRKVPDYEFYLDTLQQFFIKDSPAYKLIEGGLDWQKKKNWVLTNPYNPSHNELLDIQIITLDKNKATITTKESWYIEWLGTKSQEIEYIYDEINDQDYTLIKDEKEVWKIQTNEYESSKEREIPRIETCNTKEIVQTLQLSSRAFGQEVIAILNTGALILALVMLKCYCQDRGLEEDYDRFLVLDMMVQELMQKLNTDKLDVATYRKEKQKTFKKVLHIMRKMELL